MNPDEIISRAKELLELPPYFNAATESSGQPWNTPVWAAKDSKLNLYWSSWIKAVHSENIKANPKAFLTLFDSTRARGTNNLRCLYLQCSVQIIETEQEAEKAFSLLYPDEEMDLTDFLGTGQKRFYKAIPLKIWLNCLSERELSPSTVKMRIEIPLDALQSAN